MLTWKWVVADHREKALTVGQSAKNNEGAELQEDPLEREHLALVNKVDELDRDREVGHCNEEVAQELPLGKSVVDSPVDLRRGREER